MRADIVRPRTKGIQGHDVNSNTHIDKSVNQTRNESPTLIPHWVKNINLGSYKTVVHLCDEMQHELPRRSNDKTC